MRVLGALLMIFWLAIVLHYAGWRGLLVAGFLSGLFTLALFFLNRD